MTATRRLRIGMALLLGTAGTSRASTVPRRRIAADLQARRVWELAAAGKAPVEIARSTGLARDAVALLLTAANRPRTEESSASGTIFRGEMTSTGVSSVSYLTA
ncbi:MAG TPA: hypothetical protein VFI91_07355 [Longimicrobiaceae bacterium]|nr:hypothetical protein [Longimicrobiaceae bacterium]